jgi:hypothetical protein
LFLHRLILGAQPGDVVDHINHNKLDNRRCNLRLAGRTGNSRNRLPNKGNRFKGVRLVPSGRYQASIYFTENGKRFFKHLGTFITEREAAQAYNTAATILFGEYAWLNPL